MFGTYLLPCVMETALTMVFDEIMKTTNTNTTTCKSTQSFNETREFFIRRFDCMI
jgi:hypothetical protein